jgi:hypothetical protein
VRAATLSIDLSARAISLSGAAPALVDPMAALLFS